LTSEVSFLLKLPLKIKGGGFNSTFVTFEFEFHNLDSTTNLGPLNLTEGRGNFKRMRSLWRRFTYSVALPQSTSNDTEVVEKEVFVCKLCVEANPEDQKLSREQYVDLLNLASSP
jgi:hypothetical protein